MISQPNDWSKAQISIYTQLSRSLISTSSINKLIPSQRFHLYTTPKNIPFSVMYYIIQLMQYNIIDSDVIFRFLSSSVGYLRKSTPSKSLPQPIVVLGIINVF